MRVFLSIFGAIVLIVALIPTMVMAVAMIGMKGAFWFFGWLLTSDSPAIKGSGTPLPKDSAARMRDFLSDVVPTYYAYISAFILIMAFVLMIAYIVIAAGCILRRRRLTRSFAALGISANLGLVIWHSLQYANTPLTFNQMSIPGAWFYPEISILILAALAYMAEHRFRSEPPLVMCGKNRAMK